MKRVVFCLLLLAAPSINLHADPAVPEPEGYRMEPYRGSVPDTVRGGRVVNTPKLHALLAARRVVLIDVLPAPRRPDGMRPDAPWMPLPHEDIPGSIWLPDVGRGAINAELERYFRDHLTQATGGDRDMPVVFYCLANCWMSWNAAKRAISYGWRQVIWYPDGGDGWKAAGLPLQRAQPEPS